MSASIDFNTLTANFLADNETPVSCFSKLKQPGAVLLESMESDGTRGQFSIIGRSPIVTVTHQSGQTSLQSSIQQLNKTWKGDPFLHLKKLKSILTFENKGPFQAGFFCGYFGYHMIEYIEQLKSRHQNTDFPDLTLIIPSQIIVFDNFKQTITIAIHYLKDEKEARQQMIGLISRLDQPHKQRLQIPDFNQSLEEENIQVSMNGKQYRDAIKRAKEYIVEGDIFQTVLSRHFSTPVSQDPFLIYRMLRLINPSPYMYFLNFKDMQIIGSSPETMAKLENTTMTVYPIAGTRKRGASSSEDEKLARDLLADPKEQSEHAMLVDLARNDIGKLASFGSVTVERYMNVEKFSHVMHLSSEVTGQLDTKQFDEIDVLKTSFPAGTLSGAPKIRAMEIIDELEPSGRRLYGGAIGYLSFAPPPHNKMDTCIAIRTLWIKNKIAYWQAGAGIVHDSDPEMELEETTHKAMAICKAIAMAADQSTKNEFKK